MFLSTESALSSQPPSAPHSIHIVYDDRETGTPALAALARMPEVGLTKKRLKVGDYEVDGRLLIERKSLVDLAESIKDGRLFRQAKRLARAPIRGAVILEGTSRDLAQSEMRREAIQGALVTLALIYGLPLLRSQSPEETAQLMIYAARQIREVISGALHRKGYRPRGKSKLQLHILQGLPGVGPGRAEKLLAAFGSVEAVCRADEKELRQVSGLGRRTARAIRWALSADEEALYPEPCILDEDVLSG
ncbi:MAG: helix-hairpin-helix domain-containing protein [Candidatus Sumerlaeota bacterium]|nr:helix-hairpin-helix domain-containing protein [Candidatus Sumerlaeota bacterium]